MALESNLKAKPGDILMNRCKRTILLILITTLSLSTSLVKGQQQEENNSRLEEDQTETKVQGTAWGALLGGVIGALAGKDKKDRVKKAAIGAAIGAGAGFLLGQEVAQRKLQYANQEQAIATEMARIEQFTQQTNLANQQLKQDIQAYEQQIAQLQQRLNQGKATYFERNDQKQVIQQRQKAAEQTLTDLAKELQISQQLLEEYRQESNPAELEQWQYRIAQLEEEKHQLESSIEELTAMNSRL